MNNPKIKILSVPFTSFSLPSLEIASTLGYLKKFKFDVEAKYPAYEYANFLGWDNYKYLRDTGHGQRIFSKLLFEKDIDFVFQQNEKVCELLQQTRNFSISYIENLQIDKSSIVIFHLYNKQLIPSLYFAKKIKKSFGCNIWFSGFHCEGILGRNLRDIFPFIDETIGVNIEETILSKITGKHIDFMSSLDFLPTPDYSDFYNLSNEIKDNIPAFRKNNINYQVEYSRGCKWNKCSFCTLNCHSNSFRKRSPDLILKDYKNIVDSYKTTLIYPEHFVMPDDWSNWLDTVSNFYKSASNTMNLNFKVSDLLSEESFKILKELGANILVGTESMSTKYLKKLNKGQKVIENIQVLKLAKRWGIPCFHNMMYGLPFESEDMYLESVENIKYIFHLQPPFDIEKFRLTYGSHIFNNFKIYNIRKMYMKTENQELFPSEIRETYIPFFYDFELCDSSMVDDNKWMDLVETWRQNYYKLEYNSIPVKEAALVKSRMRDVFQIIDRRFETQITYCLTELEWKVYSYIDNIKSIDDLFFEFKNENKNDLSRIIDNFIDKKLIFKEESLLLALAI